jgi:protein-tyrosine phosphatase
MRTLHLLEHSALHPGRLLLAPAPSARQLESTADRWTADGVGLVVFLLPEREAQELGLGAEAEVCGARGIAFVSFPIEDFSAPPGPDALRALLGRIRVHLDAGEGVLLHCFMGIGRSGLVASALLAEAGLPLETAFEVVSRARGALVPESDAQRAFLEALYPEGA